MLIKKWEQLPEEMRIPALRPYYDVLRAHSGSLVLKRAFDLAGSIVLLGLLSPAFLAISAAVALDSKGGVFFTQERVTAYNRHLQIIKFRNMVPDAESLGAQLASLGAALFIVDVMLPLNYRLGPEKARPFLFAVTFLPFILLFLLAKADILDLSFLDRLRPGQVIAGFILVLLTALAGLAVSFLISCRVTERKEY